MFFRIYSTIDSIGIEFDRNEATDTGKVGSIYTLEIGTAKTAGGRIIQQIRPGKRFVKGYRMILPQDKYISFMNLLTNNSNDYYIDYETIECLLQADPQIDINNNFKIAIQITQVDGMTGSDDRNYRFDMDIVAVELL